jgi:alanine dehydrogenase
MKPGAVILDLAIDHGGCVETSRPTTFVHPTYVEHDVVHFAVPNMTADVARTASAALANAVLMYVREIAARGLPAAAAADPGLARAVVTFEGRCLHSTIAEHFGAPYVAPRDAMSAPEASNDRR